MRLDEFGLDLFPTNVCDPRISTGDQDLVLQVEEDILKAKVQDKYVMMQCLHSDGRVIFGLWFHDSNERQRTFDAMQRYIFHCLLLAKEGIGDSKFCVALIDTAF